MDGSYVGSAPGLAIFVSWTEADGKLSGTLERATVVNGKRQAVVQQSAPLVGTVTGPVVALDAALQPPIGHLSGALVGPAEFDLNYPSSADSQEAVRLPIGGAAAYADYVSVLRSQVSATNAARRMAVEVRAERKLDVKLATLVSGDLYTANAEVAAASDDGAVAALSAVNADLASVRAADVILRSASRHASAAKVCGEADAVIVAANHVDQAQAIVQGDEEGAQQDAALLGEAADTLAEDASKLQGERSMVPSYVPKSAPSPRRISSGVTDATDAGDAIASSSSAALATARALFGQASSLATQARASCVRRARRR
jgi:hypothetical protein